MPDVLRGTMGRGLSKSDLSVALVLLASEFLVDADIGRAAEPALDEGDEAIAAVFVLAEEMGVGVEEGEPGGEELGTEVGGDFSGAALEVKFVGEAELLAVGHGD